MTTRKPSISEVKKPLKNHDNWINRNKTIMIARSVNLWWRLRTLKGIECEICKGWFHTGCVDPTDNEYEMLASHKLVTIHWYCTTCNVLSVELLRLVFGLQDRIQKTKSEIKNMLSFLKLNPHIKQWMKIWRFWARK